MKYLNAILLTTFTSLCALSAQLDLSIGEAEREALEYSYLLKAAKNDVNTALQQENAGKTALYPRLSFQGTYTYALTLPELSVGAPNSPPIVFGDHSNYSVGPALSYTLWDNFASIKNFESLKKLKESRQEMASYTRLQIFLAVRSAYIKVQLALEELSLVESFLELAEKQKADVEIRKKEGAATQIDRLVANRQISARKLQFQQSQNALGSALKDLLAITGHDDKWDLSHPGSKSTKQASVVVNLDALSKSLESYRLLELSSPMPNHPQLRSQDLIAKATDLQADALQAKLLPRLDMQISASIAYPNGPELINHFQNGIGVSFSVPLFIGDPTWQLIEQKKSEAHSVRLRAMQVKADLNRDYEKAQTFLKSLYEQKITAQRDFEEAKALARLHYETYQAGKIRLIDVNAANNEALNAAVNVSRLDAHILQQIVLMMTISGKDFLNE